MPVWYPVWYDTIDRNQLLNIIATIVNEDELRIIRFLLSNTKIKTRINGATKTNTFISNVGTPQGDSLSPVLFVVYLEHALKEVRTTLPRPIVKCEKEIPNEIAYAETWILSDKTTLTSTKSKKRYISTN